MNSELRRHINLVEDFADDLRRFADRRGLDANEPLRELEPPPGADAPLFSEMLGRRIGGGDERDVYVHADDRSRVVKFDPFGDSNKAEFEAWQFVDGNHPHLRQWFAPCYAMSDDGHYLVQARAEPAYDDDLPPELPRLFDRMDSHILNFGMLNGQFACIDYTHPRTIDRIREFPQEMVPVSIDLSDADIKFHC